MSNLDQLLAHPYADLSGVGSLTTDEVDAGQQAMITEYVFDLHADLTRDDGSAANGTVREQQHATLPQAGTRRSIIVLPTWQLPAERARRSRRCLRRRSRDLLCRTLAHSHAVWICWTAVDPTPMAQLAPLLLLLQQEPVLLLAPLNKAASRVFYVLRNEWRVFWSSRSAKTRNWSPYKMHIVQCEYHLPRGSLKLECALSASPDAWVRLDDDCMQLATAPAASSSSSTDQPVRPVEVGYSFRFMMKNIQASILRNLNFVYNTSHPHSKRPIWFRLVYVIPDRSDIVLMWPPCAPQRFAFFVRGPLALACLSATSKSLSLTLGSNLASPVCCLLVPRVDGGWTCLVIVNTIERQLQDE